MEIPEDQGKRVLGFNFIALAECPGIRQKIIQINTRCNVMPANCGFIEVVRKFQMLYLKRATYFRSVWNVLTINLFLTISCFVIVCCMRFKTFADMLCSRRKGDRPVANFEVFFTFTKAWEYVGKADSLWKVFSAMSRIVFI